MVRIVCRVVWGLSEIIAIFSPVRRFSKVDFHIWSPIIVIKPDLNAILYLISSISLCLMNEVKVLKEKTLYSISITKNVAYPMNKTRLKPDDKCRKAWWADYCHWKLHSQNVFCTDIAFTLQFFSTNSCTVGGIFHIAAGIDFSIVCKQGSSTRKLNKHKHSPDLPPG